MPKGRSRNEMKTRKNVSTMVKYDNVSECYPGKDCFRSRHHGELCFPDCVCCVDMKLARVVLQR